MSDSQLASFELAVADFLRANLPDSGRVVVAFSGGGDSTAVLLAVRAFCQPDGCWRGARGGANAGRIVVAHFAHQLQNPAEFDDVAHAQKICAKLDLKLEQSGEDVRAFATDNKLSIETAARQLRYAFLADVVERTNAESVLTGHTLDDQVETVLFNIMRGSGVAGVAGMSAVAELRINSKKLKILRPLLDLRHNDCLRYCEAQKVPFLNDPSNADLAHTRNKIRHETIPQLETTVAGAFNALVRLSRNARQVENQLKTDLASHQISPTLCTHGAVAVKRKKFNALPVALKPLLLHQMWQLAGKYDVVLSQAHIDNVAHHSENSASGKTLELPAKMSLQIDHELLSLLPAGVSPQCCATLKAPAKPTRLTLNGSVAVGTNAVITAQIVSNASEPPTEASTVLVDAEKLANEKIFIRAREQGDKFTPLGKTSEIKLKDFLTKAHIPAHASAELPLVTNDKQIIWVVGTRLSENYKLTPTTKKVIKLTLSFI